MSKAPTTGRGARRDAAAAPGPGIETPAGQVASRGVGPVSGGTAARASAAPRRRTAAPAATPTAA